MDVHQCPRCELIFGSRPELEDHLREAHPPPPESDEPWRWRVLRVLAWPQSLTDPVQEQLFRRHAIR